MGGLIQGSGTVCVPRIVYPFNDGVPEGIFVRKQPADSIGMSILGGCPKRSTAIGHGFIVCARLEQKLDALKVSVVGVQIHGTGSVPLIVYPFNDSVLEGIFVGKQPADSIGMSILGGCPKRSTAIGHGFIVCVRLDQKFEALK